jgi:hypothetical protein
MINSRFEYNQSAHILMYLESTNKLSLVQMMRKGSYMNGPVSLSGC